MYSQVVVQIFSETTFDPGVIAYCTVQSHCRGDAEW